MSRTARQRRGAAAEELVAHSLAAAGWRLVGRNVRVAGVELDLVAVDPGPPAALVVVEVRSASTRRFGPPEETIDRSKLVRLYRAARVVGRESRLPDGSSLSGLRYRVDIVAVEILPASELARRQIAIRHLRGVIP